MHRYLLVFCLASAIATPAYADRSKPSRSVTEQRLGTLSALERKLLSPHLDRGPVLFTEFGHLPSVIYLARVNAPAETLFKVISEPGRYAEFMPSLESVDVESRRQNMIGYKWTWNVAMFTLTGRNVLSASPPPKDKSRGYRIEVRNTGGDLGQGRMLWRIYPDGPKRSLVMFSSRIDMRNSNYITEQLAAGGSSVNRSINIALSAVMLFGAKSEAEKQNGTAAHDTRQRPLHRPQIQHGKLNRMLYRGDIVFFDMDGDTLHQVSVVGRAGTKIEEIREVMQDPREFGQSFLYGSRAKIVERTKSGVRFDWKIPIPLIGVGGQMILRPSNKVISVDGISGSFGNGQWRFDTHRASRGQAALIGWAQFDPAESSKLIRRLIDGNKHFSHGLSAAMQLIIVRSLRSRARILRAQRRTASRNGSVARVAPAVRATVAPAVRSGVKDK